LGIFETRTKIWAESRKRGLTSIAHHLQRFSPSTAALLGLLLYFFILQGVSRFDVPASVPKLVVVGILLLVLSASRSEELRNWLRRRTGDVTIPRNEGPSLQAEGVSVAYPGFPVPVKVLSNAAIEVGPGELVQIVGDNGTGKSTLLGYLAGQIRGFGRVAIRGIDRSGNGTARLSAVALIRQGATISTCATLSVEEHCALYRTAPNPSLVRSWRRQIPFAHTILDDIACLGSAARLPVGKLSGGQ